MTTNSTKKWAIAYVLFFAVFTGTLFAQSTIDISGEYEGVRSQFDEEHKNFVRDFSYKFELIQRGNIVEGTSTIISESGNFAEVGIKGIVVGDKFYFEEYKMIDQIIAHSMVWCYKTGVLNIKQGENEIVLYGETPSYMVNYGYACSGGYTKLAAYKEDQKSVSKKSDINNTNIELNINLYPVPTYSSTQLSFDVKEASKLSIEILDLNGRTVLAENTQTVSEGQYTQSFDVSNFTAGIYIFKITTNGTVYTKEFLKLN